MTTARLLELLGDKRLEGTFALESLVATTYQVDFEFLEEELLAAALGVRAPTSRARDGLLLLRGEQLVLELLQVADLRKLQNAQTMTAWEPIRDLLS